MAEPELPDADWTDELAYVGGFREIIKVAGPSMEPALHDGELVLIDQAPEEYRVGDIVYAQHPFKKSVQLIKRIAEILDGPRYILLGDNLDESTDSRTLGAFSAAQMLGVATAKIKRSADL